MQTKYELTALIDADLSRYPPDVLAKVNAVLLNAKNELASITSIQSSLVIRNLEKADDDDDTDDDEDDLSYLDEDVLEAEGIAWGRTNFPKLTQQLADEVQRVSELIVIGMSAPGHKTFEPMRAIKSIFPESAPNVAAALAGDIDTLEGLSLTEKALILFLNHSTEAFTTLVVSYLMTCFDLHKMFGLLLSGKTNIDCLLAFLQEELVESDFEDLPLDKELLSNSLDFVADMFNFRFFSVTDLPVVDNPMKDLGCLFGEIQKPNLTIIKS